MATPLGIILLGHEVLDAIPQAVMLAAIPAEYVNLPRHHISLTSVKAKLADLGTLDWITARSHQEAEVIDKLKPIVDGNPGWRVQYFGAAPIPLAMALGYQLTGWAEVDVYQKGHAGDATWEWPKLEKNGDLLCPLNLPNERVKAVGDLVVRISLSHVVHADDSGEIVAEPLGEIDIAMRTPHEDGLRSTEDLGCVTAQFGDALDWAHEYRPNAQIHVFASLSVGAALRFGMSVNPTIHGPIHAYQYFGSQSPAYQRAFVLQQPARAEPVLTAEDRLSCMVLRDLASTQLKGLESIIAQQNTDDTSNWLEDLFPDCDLSVFDEGFRRLSKIKKTPLAASIVDLKATDVPDGFSYDTEKREWRLADGLLHAIGKRIDTNEAQKLAIRLFFLHEAIHQGAHRLRGGVQIRKFPNVLETLDYQADCWAFLHEVAFSRLAAGQSEQTGLRILLLDAIKVAVSTFWAFDAATDPSRMEVRRVNRYLIWYWQRLQIEGLQDNDVGGCLRVLAQKPIIEIAGAKMRIVGDRVYFFLDEVENAEIAFLSQAQLHRFGHGAGSQVATIFQGIRDRNDDLIAGALRTIAMQVAEQ